MCCQKQLDGAGGGGAVIGLAGRCSICAGAGLRGKFLRDLLQDGGVKARALVTHKLLELGECFLFARGFVVVVVWAHGVLCSPLSFSVTRDGAQVQEMLEIPCKIIKLTA